MDLTAIILKARNARDSYINDSKQPDALPISIEDLKVVISNSTKKDIKVFVVDPKFIQAYIAKVRPDLEDRPVRLKGRCDNYVNNANIIFPGEPRLTYCEQRYVAVKEMAHLVIDSPETYTEDVDAILALVRGLVYPPSLNVGEYSEANQSEVLAEVFALELLFPWRDRAAVIAEVEAGVPHLEVAKRYKIPVKSLIWILSQHEPIAESHETIRATLNLEREEPHPEEDGKN